MPRRLPLFTPLPFRPCRHSVIVASPQVRERALEFGGMLPRLCSIAAAEPLPGWNATSPFGIDPHGLMRLIRVECNERMSATGLLAAAASPRRCRDGWNRLATVLGRRHGLADLVVAWLRDRSPTDATDEDRRLVRDLLAAPPVAEPSGAHKASWIGYLLSLHVLALEHAVACDGALMSMARPG